jgi:hypothetical protein
LYRASADTFFVPFPVTPYAQPEDLLLREYEPLHRRLLANFLEAGIEFVGIRSVNDFGLSVQLGQGGLRVNHGPNPRLGLTINPTVPHAPAILSAASD